MGSSAQSQKASCDFSPGSEAIGALASSTRAAARVLCVLHGAAVRVLIPVGRVLQQGAGAAAGCTCDDDPTPTLEKAFGCCT